MASVTLQFSRQSGFFSWLISYFAHGEYSHVDAVEKDGRLYGSRSDICAEVKAGVQSRPDSYGKFIATKRVTLTITDEQADKFWDFMYNQRGKPYDKMAILAFAIDRNWREDDSWYCSELVASGLEYCDFFAHPLCVRAAKITPDDLLLVLSAVTSLT